MSRYEYPYKAGIPERTDTAGNQAGKPHWNNRTVSAECGGCRKTDTAYGHKNELESYVLEVANYKSVDLKLKSVRDAKGHFPKMKMSF